jgi:hypothetical protein
LNYRVGLLERWPTSSLGRAASDSIRIRLLRVKIENNYFVQLQSIAFSAWKNYCDTKNIVLESSAEASIPDFTKLSPEADDLKQLDELRPIILDLDDFVEFVSEAIRQANAEFEGGVVPILGRAKNSATDRAEVLKILDETYAKTIKVWFDAIKHLASLRFEVSSKPDWMEPTRKLSESLLRVQRQGYFIRQGVAFLEVVLPIGFAFLATLYLLYG